MRKVVVTGIGAVSPLGNTFAESWAALKDCRSGIGPASRADVSSLPWTAAGEVKGFRAEDYMPGKDLNRYDLFVQYAAAAGAMAARDASMEEFPPASAVVFGSSRGGIGALEGAVTGRASAYLMSGSTVSMAASYVAAALGVRGHLLGVSNACSSGSVAVGEAFRLIKHGQAEAALAGGADAPLCRLSFRGYGAMGALSALGVSRPFDRKRDGFVLAEGAAALVLEERQRAMARGARIYGEIRGYGNTAEGFHQSAPSSPGQIRAVLAALREAGASPGDVALVSAHAASTRLGDAAEAETIGHVFGARRPFVCAAKSMTGHMLGASGALEVCFSLMSMGEGVVPPTANLDEPEAGLNLALKAVGAGIETAVCNSFGFGGVNSVLVLSAHR